MYVHGRLYQPLDIVLFGPLSIFYGLSDGPSWVPILIFMILHIIYNSCFIIGLMEAEVFGAGVKATVTSAFAVLFWHVSSGLLVAIHIKSGFGGLLA